MIGEAGDRLHIGMRRSHIADFVITAISKWSDVSGL
jgi:hypothetical protein